MSYNILTAKAELAGMLHGTTLSQVENINGIFNRAGRQLLLDIDPTETKRITSTPITIYYGIFDYTAPADLKGNKIIDIAPQSNRGTRDVFNQTYNRAFDVNKNIGLVNKFTILQNAGVKTVRIDYNDRKRIINIEQMNSLDGNGLWSASGTVSNLAQNSQVINNSNSVLGFDITAGAGYITNSTIPAIDLSNNYNNAIFPWDFYIPDASKLTSVGIRIGSDSSNYYETTGITSDLQGNDFANGFNQGYALWSDMTTVGSPDKTAITYARLTFTASDSMNDCWVSNLNSNLGWLSTYEYYSKYLFSDVTTGDWQETVTDDSNIINLDTESYNLFLYQAAFLCVQQSLGQDASYDTNIFLDLYDKGLDRYKKMYKSEVTKPQLSYYKTNRNNKYQEYLGRNY